jgi:hypothetical protein
MVKPKELKVGEKFRGKEIKEIVTPKHAHFAIDFYGKLCSNKKKAMKVFNTIIEV